MILFAAVVLLVGIPSAVRIEPTFRFGFRFRMVNATALALVGCYVFVQAAWAVSGVIFPIGLFLLLDLAVIVTIFCKPEARDLSPYRNMTLQLKAAWLERSLWDRIVLAAFPLIWAAYALDLSDFARWWALYWLSLAQFVAAGGEAFETYRSRRAANAKGTTAPDIPSSSAEYAWAGGYRDYG